jgi:hypothetical protein
MDCACPLALWNLPPDRVIREMPIHKGAGPRYPPGLMVALLYLSGRILRAGLLTTIGAGVALAADPVFSGPQAGEKTTGFKVLEITGAGSGQERDPITDNAGAPTALVFVHTLERSLVPLLRSIDVYGASNRARLKTEVIFLAPDRLAGEQRIRAASGSLRLASRVGLSLDGPEGPGNYGLNKDCLMTIVGARSNLVVTNFALVQPGIADAPPVIAALAALCGDLNPPTAEALLARANAGRGTMMSRGQTNASGSPSQDPFPGAVPTDPKLQGLLRSFIRPTNDDARVDAVLAEVKAYIQNDSELKKQARDGWTRVLHFGDRYGTAYSRKVGAEFLESLKKE